jgi:hypothetical protein
MHCDKHVLNVHWQHHHWVRNVSATERHANLETDMWGRKFDSEHVTCHVTYVCNACGATRDGGECGCDMRSADGCPPRVAYLDGVGRQAAG